MELLQPLPATSVAFLKEESTFGRGKEGVAANEKMAFGRTNRAHSKGKDDKVLEGAISCLYFGERCKEVPDPELFIGFESGAVGMFRIFVTQAKKGASGMQIQAVKMFSCQKVIQDIKVRHVLSFSSLHLGKKDTEDFTLAIGYYASLMQTISFVSGYEQDSYTMVD